MSAWSVGEHVEHLLLADRWIVSWMKRVIDEPGGGAAAGRPTLPGRLVLLAGFIPRGRGRAPGPTVPGGMSVDELRAGLAGLRLEVARLEGRLAAVRACRARVAHPVLGRLSPAEWLRFLVVHHRHHEKLVDEILSRV